MPLGAVWSDQEDANLRRLVTEFGPKKWSIIAAKLKTKGSKQCRRRWKNFLNADLKSGGWTAEEDNILVDGHKKFGNKWTEIAKLVGGRTDNAVKNRWAALCKRSQKLARGGVLRTRRPKPVVHNGPPDAAPPPPAASADVTLAGIKRPRLQLEGEPDPKRRVLLKSGSSMSGRAGPSLLKNTSIREDVMEHRSRHLLRNESSMRTPRTPRTPRLLQQVQEAAARQASGLNSNHSSLRSAETFGRVSQQVVQATMVKKPSLSINIPNAASADPNPVSNGTIEIRVLKDLLTPCEIQYAKELNDMQLPLHINVADEPPLSTSRWAAQNAISALMSPTLNGMADFGDVLKWFQTGLTPRSTAPANDSTPSSTSTGGSNPSSGRFGRSNSSRRYRALEAAAANAAPATAPATAGPCTSEAVPDDNPCTTTNAPLVPGVSLSNNPMAGMFLGTELHAGHRQLLSKLFHGAAAVDDVTDGAEHLRIEGKGLRIAPPSPSAKSEQLQSNGMFSPGFLFTARGNPPKNTDILMTPQFSAQELGLLLDALNSEELQTLPPAPALV